MQNETSLDEFWDAARTENEVDASVLFVLPPLLLSPFPDPPPELVLEELEDGMMQGCCSTEFPPTLVEDGEVERVLETAL